MRLALVILPPQFCSASQTWPMLVSGGSRCSARLIPTCLDVIPLAGSEARRPADAGQPKSELLMAPSSKTLPLLRSEHANHPTNLPVGLPTCPVEPTPCDKVCELSSLVLRSWCRQPQSCKVWLRLQALVQTGINSGRPLKIPLGFRIS